jgi:hypothetical protein
MSGPDCIETVRARPGMFVGSTGPHGILLLVLEPRGTTPGAGTQATP